MKLKLTKKQQQDLLCKEILAGNRVFHCARKKVILVFNKKGPVENCPCETKGKGHCLVLDHKKGLIP